jgi:hypothetical protein
MNSKVQTILLVLILIAIGLVGYKTLELQGLDWRQDSNLPMSPKKLQEEQMRYWFGSPSERSYATGSPKVIVYGDSQAFDVYATLKNNPSIGLIYFPHSFKCSAFFSTNFGMDGTPAFCRSFFETLLQSKEIRQAQYLIYTHEWEKVYETVESYPIALAEIKKINPNIKIIFFGPKPYLKGGSINAIIRKQSPFKLNEYLNSVKRIDEKNTNYSRDLAKSLNVQFVDVFPIFCSADCPFYLDKQFTYFDSNHWTEYGAKIFYERLERHLSF